MGRGSERHPGRVAVAAVLAAAVACGSFGLGACVAKRGDAEIEQAAEQAAFERIRGDGNVPGVREETVESEVTKGLHFQPSDQAPKCLPTGTVTYEVFDSAANRRYWVFRWPEDKGYSIVPRDMVNEEGELAPYVPGWRNAGSEEGDAEGAEGAVDERGTDDAVETR